MIQKSELTLEKLKINERLLLIEKYILEGKEQRMYINDTMNNIDIRCRNIELMIHGESDNNNKRIRDGINRRVESLEFKDESAEKIKGGFLKVAVGSLTLAVGSCILWIGKTIWNAWGK